MPAQVVNLTDTFDEWRIKTNTIATQSFSALSNVVDDTTPQLGVNLDLNSNDITGTGSIAGTVTGTTQSASDNSTKLATTAYVDAQVATEDTLAEMNDTNLSSLANLDILQYNSSSSVWENKPLSSAGIPTKGFTVAMAVALG